jgi:hypothetical protein
MRGRRGRVGAEREFLQHQVIPDLVRLVQPLRTLTMRLWLETAQPRSARESSMLFIF